MRDTEKESVNRNGRKKEKQRVNGNGRKKATNEQKGELMQRRELANKQQTDTHTNFHTHRHTNVLTHSLSHTHRHTHVKRHTIQCRERTQQQTAKTRTGIGCRACLASPHLTRARKRKEEALFMKPGSTTEGAQAAVSSPVP